MVLALLAVQLQIQNGKASIGRPHLVTTAPVRKPRTYKIDFLAVRGMRNCPVEGCWVGVATKTEMQVEFSTGMSRTP